MSNEAPTEALRLVPSRDDGLTVGRAILEAHSQWEKEHGVTGAQNPWQEQHITLLGQAAILAAPASPLPEGGGQCSGITGELSGWQDMSTAPKDGMCFDSQDRTNYKRRVFRDTYWYVHPAVQGFVTKEIDCTDYEFEPTHWRPASLNSAIEIVDRYEMQQSACDDGWSEMVKSSDGAWVKYDDLKVFVELPAAPTGEA